MNKNGGAEWFLYSAIGVMCFLVVEIVGCGDSVVPANMEIVVERSTIVLGKPECSFNPHGEAKEITVLQKGDKAPVLGTEYTKDCMVYKIKLADGRIGYVTFGDKFRVIEHYDTTFSVLVEDSTNLMTEPDSVGAPGNKVIAILQAGEQGKAISDNYWDKTTYYYIKLEDGRTGYVKHDEKIRVMKEPKNNLDPHLIKNGI